MCDAAELGDAKLLRDVTALLDAVVLVEASELGAIQLRDAAKMPDAVVLFETLALRGALESSLNSALELMLPFVVNSVLELR